MRERKDYYVYICFLFDEIVYVGKGTKDRIKHCNSGKSSNVRLNEAFFKHGKDSIRTVKVLEDCTEDQALKIEKHYIDLCIQQGITLYNVGAEYLVEPSPYQLKPWGLGIDALTIPNWFEKDLQIPLDDLQKIEQTIYVEQAMPVEYHWDEWASTCASQVMVHYKDKSTETNDELEISKEDFEGEHWQDDFDYGDVPDWAK